VIVPTPEVEAEDRSLSAYMRLPVDQYVGIEVGPYIRFRISDLGFRV
jgi:hypothetical protein